MSGTASEPTQAVMSETESASNSHNSSFDESLVSQSSNREPPSTEVTQQFKTTPSQDITTPPTTTSNFSSQESPAHELRGSPYRPSAKPPVAETTARLRPLSVNVNGIRQPYSYLAARGNTGNIPNKRLANGEVKYGERSRSNSPPNPERYGHSRSTSINLKDSPIREVSLLALASQQSTSNNFHRTGAAFKSTPNSPIICHGQSPEWLGVSQH